MSESAEVFCLLLIDQTTLISEVQEVYADIGKPDCKLINPFVVNSNGFLTKFLDEYTDDNEIMIQSDKILTIIQPKEELIEKYKKVVQ